jgi:hypothetical protein
MTYYSKFLEDVTSSSTPPADPVKDQLWWRLPEQTLYIWDGALWVLNKAVLANDPSKAPLDSPVFTGNPRAPTPAQGDSDTSIATTAFVKIALDNDTADWTQILNKPATYPPTLPITQSGVTNLESDLDLKAPKDNPIFTGNPRAPTPSPGDNDTSIATTAFVQSTSAGLFPSGTIAQYLRGDKSWQTLDKYAVGLDQLNNTSDANKPVSTAQNTADLLRVLKAGDTMSGPLTISPPSQTALLNLLALGSQSAGIIFSNDASSSSVYLESRTGTSTRWQIFLGDNVAESGVGSESGGTNFSLRRFRNDGVFLGDVITVLRSDGIVNFIMGATAPTPTLGDSTTKVATTAFVTGSIGNKEPVIAPGSTSQYWRGDKSWQVLNKASVGLNLVDNTSDINKPISIATQTVLDTKAPIDTPTFTGKVTIEASTAGSAAIRAPHGAVPTTPVNGDFWSTSTGFYGQVNGVTVGPWGPGIQGIPGIQGPPGVKGDPGPMGGQFMYIGDGPPANPTIGQTWFESDTGHSFIYYSDGTGAPQWIPTHVGPLPEAATVPVGEAPLDGKQYARKDASWAVVVGGGGSGTSDWADITNKPATFPPTLPIPESGVTNLVTDLAGKAPTVHSHAQTDITGLVTALSGKEPTILTGPANQFWRGDKTWGAIPIQDWSQITGKPSTFPPTAHVHPIGEVTGLQTALDNANAAILLRAPIASPTFTGKVTMPSATTGSAAFNLPVSAAMPAAPVDGDFWFNNATGVLNFRSGGTSFIVATTLSLVPYAPLASPALTGNPTAPTPTTADNDTSIATTAYVQAQGYLTSSTASATFVDVAGDTMTGDLSINKTGPTIVFNRPTAGSQGATFIGSVNWVQRWGCVLGNSAAESGGNAGSNFAINRYSDAGAFIDIPFTIDRATGQASVNMNPTVNLGIATKQYVDAVSTSVNSKVSNVTGTAPVVSTGGTTPAISMPPASSSVNGYLSSTDWTAFNAKTSEAPTDGKQYARQNSSWAEVVSSGSSVLEYTYYGTVTAPPASGQVRFDNASFGAVTKMWIHDVSALSRDVRMFMLNKLKKDTLVYLQDKDDGSKWIEVKLTADCVGLSGYVEASVVYMDGTVLNAGQRVLVSAVSPSAGGAAVAISDTAPVTPTVGQLWFETDSGNTYIWYDDGDSQQWIMINYPGSQGLPADVHKVPLSFPMMNKPNTNGVINIPVAMRMVIPAGLAGTNVWQGILTTANATFTLNKISPTGTITQLGTIVMNPASKTACTLSGTGGSLEVGETLQLAMPTVTDTTLGDLGITVLATRT